MKRAILLLAVMLLLTACGGNSKEEVQQVNLTDFYGELAKKYQWDDVYMQNIEGEMLENSYPGLSDIKPKQFVAKMPLMSSVVNELVFMECETEEDAAKAAAILQNRIDTQSEGGAWYPESMEAWGKGIVLQQGNYVAMIASAEHQDEIMESFTQKFQ